MSDVDEDVGKARESLRHAGPYSEGILFCCSSWGEAPGAEEEEYAFQEK